MLIWWLGVDQDLDSIWKSNFLEIHVIQFAYFLLVDSDELVIFVFVYRCKWECSGLIWADSV